MASGLDMLKELAAKARSTDADAEAIYQQIRQDELAHIEKHINAMAIDHPEKAEEVATLQDIVTRAKGDDSVSVITALHDLMDGLRG